MKSNILSIIVPIYGVEKYLRQCLDSILSQTYRDFEVLLVDDGSKDRCPAICDEYAVADSRFRVIHKPNGGYGNAVNRGLDEARGAWIAIVEPDDWIEKMMFEVLMARAEETSADVVRSDFTSFPDGNDGGQVRGHEVRHDGSVDLQRFNLHDLPFLLGLHPAIWTCVYKTSFLRNNNIRMAETPGAGWQDNLFQVQTLVFAHCISYVPVVFYHYRTFPEKQRVLKDWRLPYRVSEEIHAWLQAIGMNDKAIWDGLLFRELYYLEFMARSVSFWEFRSGVCFIRKFTDLLKTRISDDSFFSDQQRRDNYEIACRCPVRFIARQKTIARMPFLIHALNRFMR